MTMTILTGAISEAVNQIYAKSMDDRYYNDPVLWAEEVLGVHLWSKQQEICYSVRDHRHTAVRSSNGTGKTMTMGVLGSWWIATRYPRDPAQTIVVTTAPSFPQVKTNLFHEFQVNWTRSREKTYPNGEPKGNKQIALPGRILLSGNIAEWKDDFGNQLAIGRKPAESEIVVTFQGIHRRNVLFIIDEAGGMAPDMFVAAEAMTTNVNSRIAAVGNPDVRGSEFFKMFQPDSDWNKIHISSFDTPSFTGEPCPKELLDYMPSPEWVERNLKAWGGPDDPRSQVRIYGNFPDMDDTVFFSERIINKAIETEIDPLLDEPIILGVDLAMQGSDESRIYRNQGGKIRLYKAWPGNTAKENAETIFESIKETDADIVNIDSGGIGTPIIERLKELVAEAGETIKPFQLTSMNSSQISPDPRRWYNSKAYWYDSFRSAMIQGKIDLDIDKKVRDQMTDINYSIWETGNRAGSILMESKKDMRKRVGYSPDDVDAMVYSYFNPDVLLEKDTPKKAYTDPLDIIGGEEFLPNYLEQMGFDYGINFYG